MNDHSVTPASSIANVIIEIEGMGDFGAPLRFLNVCHKEGTPHRIEPGYKSQILLGRSTDRLYLSIKTPF
jgi:hypothetical protein